MSASSTEYGRRSFSDERRAARLAADERLEQQLRQRVGVQSRFFERRRRRRRQRLRDQRLCSSATATVI